jgi:hypothetical protein
MKSWFGESHTLHVGTLRGTKKSGIFACFGFCFEWFAENCFELLKSF